MPEGIGGRRTAGASVRWAAVDSQEHLGIVHAGRGGFPGPGGGYRDAMSTPENDPTTVPVSSDDAPTDEPDAQSDPAMDDGDSTDWSSEGGAATEGPATDTDNS